MCDHSNESYGAVLSCGTVFYAVQGGSKFSFCGRNPTVIIQILSFMWYCLLCWKKSSSNVISVNEFLLYDHSNAARC